MKLVIVSSLLAIISFTSCSLSKELLPTFYKVKSEQSAELNGRSKFVFVIENLDPQYYGSTVMYSIDKSQTKNIKLEKNAFEVITSPGKHVLDLHINFEYYEIHSDTLIIEKNSIDTYNINAERSGPVQYQLEKPVIYLYPEKTQDVEPTVIPSGELYFTYPEMGEVWKVKASSNGDLKINGKHYNYLFWESRQPAPDVILNEGFIVEGHEIVPFLEEKLDEVGLNSKEAADFITYWGPRIAQEKQVFIRFEQNDACDKYGELIVSPKPDHVNRLYIIWLPVNETFETNKEQKLMPIDRKGFDILEWGGMEIIQNKVL